MPTLQEAVAQLSLLPGAHHCIDAFAQSTRPLESPPTPRLQASVPACPPAAGLESIYVWEGKVNRGEELLLMIKSRQALVPALTQHVKGMHPYDECEVIALPITGGSASYLKWVLDNTKAAA